MAEINGKINGRITNIKRCPAEGLSFLTISINGIKRCEIDDFVTIQPRIRDVICHNAEKRYTIYRCRKSGDECNGKGEYTTVENLGMEYSHRCKEYDKQTPIS